jgi:hypothetical protein
MRGSRACAGAAPGDGPIASYGGGTASPLDHGGTPWWGSCCGWPYQVWKRSFSPGFGPILGPFGPRVGEIFRVEVGGVGGVAAGSTACSTA